MAAKGDASHSAREGAQDTTDPRLAWLGQVIVVPDRHWGFRAPGREGHPGACLAPADPAQRDLPILKGRSGSETSPWPTDFEVLPDAENGLSKPTWFQLVPRFLRRRHLELMQAERRTGRLSAEDRARLLAELRRVLDPGSGL
ncbi:MAG: hypothetical protein P1V81_16950 [Planctomycetota bacterium]|nr:hypothetical protein [Planctomycetota bacterium]